MKPYACIACYKEIQITAFGEPNPKYPLDAALYSGMPQYGSDYDYYDTTLYFHICDECIQKAENKGLIYTDTTDYRDKPQPNYEPVKFDENWERNH